jgi:hypothetical protein
VLHEESNPTTSRRVCVLDAEEIIDNRIDTCGSIGALSLSMRALGVRVIGVGLVLKKLWSGIWNR